MIQTDGGKRGIRWSSWPTAGPSGCRIDFYPAVRRSDTRTVKAICFISNTVQIYCRKIFVPVLWMNNNLMSKQKKRG